MRPTFIWWSYQHFLKADVLSNPKLEGSEAEENKKKHFISFHKEAIKHPGERTQVSRQRNISEPVNLHRSGFNIQCNSSQY